MCWKFIIAQTQGSTSLMKKVRTTSHGELVMQTIVSNIQNIGIYRGTTVNNI